MSARNLSQAAESVENVTMELGGLAPLIVHEDADIEYAVDQTIAQNSVMQDKLVFVRTEFTFTKRLKQNLFNN